MKKSYIDDLKEENLLVNFDDVSFDVSNIAYDSKKVSKGTLFVCKGAAFKIPASVQQAAQQQNLPDLPKLWAFMQLCDLAYLKDKDNAAFLKKASRDVTEFAAMMKGGDGFRKLTGR